MRMRRFIPPAFLVPVACVAWALPAYGQPNPPPSTAPVGAGQDVPATSPPSPPPEAVPAPAQAAPPVDATKAVAAEFTSLHILLAKGVITQAEYDSALRDLGETSGMKAGDGNTFVLGKWATTLYGFIEGDTIYDTTQSLNEIAGNAQIARSGTYAGDHDRTQFSIRNSRFGLRLKAPETNGIRASAQLEMDFFGGPQPASGAEATVFNNSILRIRHANFKVETPIVDIMVGQYWTLFGWQAQYLPASVEIQGMPGGIFSRQVQVRLSKTVKTSDITFEAAIAASRPPQRDSALPAGQGGLRFAVNKWTAPQTANFTGTTIQPLSIAVTGDVRSVRVPEFSAAPKASETKSGAAFAVDAFIPVIPGKKETKGNSLALNGEFSTGYGAGDMYTGLIGGVGNPTLPNPAAANPAPAYDPRIDPGIAMYDAQLGLHMVQWTNYLAGIQYYFPGSGNVFIAANYSHAQSANTKNLGTGPKTREAEDFVDGNLYWDMTSAIRWGAEYAVFRDTYNDGQHATNQRVQVSGAFLF
jgi:hypothetical protein